MHYFLRKCRMNEKNPSFLHKVTCIPSYHTGTVAMFHIHGFLLQEDLVLLITLKSISKVITKSKVGSLTMQPAIHDVTGMPLYLIYTHTQYTPVRYGWLYVPLFCLLILQRKLLWKFLKNFAKYREILPKVLKNNLKIFKRKIG